MKRVGGITESRGPKAPGLRFMEMRVEDDLCALPHRRTDGFWIAPPFMADDDPESQRSGAKDAPSRAVCVERLDGRIELDLVLKPGDRSVRIDDERGEHEAVVDEAFGSDDGELRVEVDRSDGSLDFRQGPHRENPGV